MTAARITIIIIFGILPYLAAQEPADLLEKASLVENREGDFAAALVLYARVADDRGADVGTRTTAQLRKALVEKKLGREEAARASLERAAKGEGVSAERARALLEQKTAIQDEDWQISGRVHRAIAKLYKAETYEEALSDLAMIGEAAVPPLAEALRNEKTDIAFVGRGVGAMRRIGGPRVGKWFSAMVGDDDQIYRRTVLTQLVRETVQGRRDDLIRMQIQDDLVRLLEDPDLDLAGNACDLLGRMRAEFDPAAYFAFLVRCDAARLADQLGNFTRLGLHERAIRDEQLRKEVLDHFVRFMQRGNADLGSRLQNTVSLLSSRLGDEGLDLWFDFATRSPAEIPGMSWRARSGPRSSDYGLARALVFFKRIPGAEWAAHREASEEARAGSRLSAMTASLTDLIGLNNQGRGDVAAALELIALGDANRAMDLIEQLVWKQAEPDQLQRCIELVERFARPEYVAYTISRHHKEPKELDIGGLVAWLKAEAPRARDEGEFIQGRIGQMIQPLVLREDPANLKQLMTLLDTDPRFYYPLCERLTKIDPKLAFEHLLTLIARKDEGRLAASARHLVFQRLLESGDERVIPALIASAKVGLRFSADYQDGTRKNTYPAPSPKHSRISGVHEIQKLGVWTDEQLATIVAGVLDGDGEAPWYDLARNYDSNSDFWISYSAPLRRLIERRVLDAPENLRRKMIDSILGFPARIVEPDLFIPAVLAQPDLGLMAEAIDAIQRPYSEVMRSLVARILTEETRDDVVEAALKSARYAKDPALREGIRMRLVSANATIRRRALEALVAIDREAALPEILGLAADDSAAVRGELCASLALVPDRRSVPVLIELLKDPGANVREEADAALRQVQFYFEQKDRWEKWLRGAGLESENAAEALLEQAAPDQPRAQRLVAIASLGTLGVPETLPILIRWMTDSDAEIAAAAKAAVEKINGD